MRPFVAEQVIAVALAVPVIVERLAVVGGQQDDRPIGQPTRPELLEQAPRGVIDRAHRAVVEAADLPHVGGVGRPLGAEPDRLLVLEAPPVRRIRVARVVRGRGRVREVRGREEHGQEERLGSARQATERRDRVGGEQLGVGAVGELAHLREERAPDARVEHGQERRLSLERALTEEHREVERGRVDQLEAQVDATEDVAGVVADHAGAITGAGEPRGQRVEVTGALVPGGEHRADLVVVRVAAGEERDPRREGPRQRHVRLVERDAAGGERRERGRARRVEAVGPERVGRDDEERRARAGGHAVGCPDLSG